MSRAAGQRAMGTAEGRVDALFRALADPTRRRLLTRLTVGPARVTDLARPFRMSLPAVSKHLRILERAGLIERAVDGRVHRLSLSGEPLRQVEVWLDPFRGYWEGTFAALRADLTRHPPEAGRRSVVLRRRRRAGPARTGPGRARRRRSQGLTER